MSLWLWLISRLGQEGAEGEGGGPLQGRVVDRRRGGGEGGCGGCGGGSHLPSLLPPIAARSTNQPTNQPTRQPAARPDGQPTNQPANQPPNRPTSLHVGRVANHPANEPTSQPTEQYRERYMLLSLYSLIRFSLLTVLGVSRGYGTSPRRYPRSRGPQTQQMVPSTQTSMAMR